MTADPFATPGDKIPTYDRPRGDAEDRAPVPRDQWDRYLIPNLDGSKPAANKGFTRVSTLKDAAIDKRGVAINDRGLVAHGIATVPALAKAAAEAVRDEDKKALRAVAARAIDAAGGKDRAALGTAVHDATERINRGEQDVHVPDEYRADVDGYYQLLAENNVRIKPEFMERVVLCPYNSAGTFDNVVEWFNPEAGELDDDGKPIGEWEWLIADLKTGRTLKDGHLEIMIQLWLYANAHGVLDLDTMTYSPLPVEVRRDKAMIVHVPMAGGVAELFVIDISGAERYVRAAVELRRGNREAESKWRSVGKVSPAPFVLNNDGSPQTGVSTLAKEAAQVTLTDADPASGAPLTDVLDHVVYRTPQQLADVETAERRRAMHQGGPQSGTVPVDSREIGAIIPIAKAVGLNRDPLNLDVLDTLTGVDGEGKPLAPLAGPGKRGCSKCGRTGHRSTSKRCLGDADPAKNGVATTGAGESAVPLPVGEQGPEPFTVPDVLDPHLFDPLPGDKLGRCRLCGQGPSEPIHAPVRAADTADGDDAPAPGTPDGGPPLPEPVYPAPPVAVPWCDVPQHRSQGWTAGPDGTAWVCPVDGRPSRESYERSQVDPIAAAIEACTTPDQVIALRTHYTIQWDGGWTPTYDEQARLKHQSLSWPNP